MTDLIALAERCEAEAANWPKHPIHDCLVEAAHWLRVEARQARAQSERTMK